MCVISYCGRNIKKKKLSCAFKKTKNHVWIQPFLKFCTHFKYYFKNKKIALVLLSLSIMHDKGLIDPESGGQCKLKIYWNVKKIN